MSFKMTGDITVGPYKPFKCHSATWNWHIDNYTNTASFTIPAFCRVITNSQITAIKNEAVPTGLQFTEGMPVAFSLGYDDINPVRFKGFIKRINFTVPLQVECEGYSYLLRKVMFSKAYRRTTVKQVLQDLIALVPGNQITLSPYTQDITFEPFTFQSYPGVKVLEFLKEKYLLTVFFNGNVLYAGLRETIWNNSKSEVVNHRLNWNVIKDDQLLFNADKEFTTVNIQLKSLNSDGTRNKATNRLLTPGNVKRLRTLLKDVAWLKKAANEQKTMLNNKGYSGVITGFLIPYAEPGMASNITDRVYPEKRGLYFIEGVEGSFGPGGGRQKIAIGNSL